MLEISCGSIKKPALEFEFRSWLWNGRQNKSWLQNSFIYLLNTAVLDLITHRKVAGIAAS